MFTVSHSIMHTNDSTTVDNSPSSMALQVNALAQASLRDLPAEIYVFVMERISEFSVLNNFINAFPRMAPIFRSFQKRIFIGVLRSSGLSLQLQKIITAIMILRGQYPATPCPPKAFFDRYLDRKDQPVDMMRFADPIGMLRYIVRTTESIDQYVASFVQMRILVHKVTDLSLSDTESYRVRRAFWRFQLCYELTHPGGSVDVRHNAEAPERWERRYIGNEDAVRTPLTMKGWLFGRGETTQAPILKDFLQTLCPWEIEEIIIARFHLITKVNAFQYNRIAGISDDLRNQNSLLQRLVMDLDNWQRDLENPKDHLLLTNLRAFHRDPDLCHDPEWLGNPPGVASENIEPVDDLDLGYTRPQWWCMWDVQRLSACGFIGHYDHIEVIWIGNPSTRIFWNIKPIKALIDTQFSAIDNQLSERFLRQFEWELQAHEHGEHMRRKEWLMNWVSTRDQGLYREWRDICASTPFNYYRAQTCYLRALTLKRAVDRERRASRQL